MPQNDYICVLVKQEINNLKNNNNQLLKQRGTYAAKAFPKINCLVCMDTRELWAWRRDAISRSIFSSHQYDLIHCNGCSTGKDKHTMSSTKGYEKNCTNDISGRINELVKLYHTQIKPEEENVESPSG